MANPTRDTTAGRVYNDLRNLARRTSRSTDEYVLERFLYRLAASPLGREHFVLKGGLLLAQFGARRMTRDIDILGRSFPGTETEIVHRIAVIAATEIDDGVAFDPATLKTVPNREEDECHGVRLSMAASIARARLKLQLDVSFGDPVTPGPQIVDYAQQLTAESFQILGYPLATVLAEKLSTAVSLGDLNTRDRDYADLYRLLTLNDLDGQELTTALTATATHRGITLKPLSTAISDLGERRQTSYTAWRHRQGAAATGYPERFTDVVRQVTAFADTLLKGDAATRTWNAATLTWS
ncbi:nucleotidyl transferase AbiEii/AbiGii toxin family protein [Streptomyces canus]|uniref:nucleotidyl transferase AbiEii/AbiGii toxin family protein n=1 Tax=Streptomyces canus TaxID=58343 RepID=UPI0032513666